MHLIKKSLLPWITAGALALAMASSAAMAKVTEPGADPCEPLYSTRIGGNSSNHYKTIELFVAATAGINGTSEPKELAERIASKNPEFKARLAEARAQGPLTDTILKDLLISHHRAFMSQFDNEAELQRMRNAALKADLAKHGLKEKADNAREALKDLSARNLERLMRLDGLSAEYLADPEIAAFVSKYELRVIRFSHTDLFSGDMLISSRQITRYGLPGGLQSQEKFNTHFLQSDNNVYFHVDFVRKGGPGLRKTSQYGDVRSTLRPDYAREHGWISPYLMSPMDLYYFAEYGTPGIEFKPPRAEFYGENGKPPPEAVRALSRVYTYDFTYDDYLSLMRHRLGTLLWAAKRNGSYATNPWKDESLPWGEFLPWLAEDDSRLQAALEGKYKFGLMEFKVPVAVPRSGFL